MTDDSTTVILTTIITGLVTCVTTIGSVYWGTRYAAELPVEETRRQREEDKKQARLQAASDIIIRFEKILDDLNTSLSEVSRLLTFGSNGQHIVVSQNKYDDKLHASAALISTKITSELHQYRRVLDSATRFENEIARKSVWDTTRHHQQSWIATLILQALRVIEATTEVEGIKSIHRSWFWHRRMRWLRWNLPRRWKNDAGL